MWSQRVGHRRLQPSIGPYGSQWTMCVLPKQLQPHPHFEMPVGVQTTGVSGSSQTDLCTLWGNPSRGSDTPPLHAGPLVHGLWGEPVGGVYRVRSGRKATLMYSGLKTDGANESLVFPKVRYLKSYCYRTQLYVYIRDLPDIVHAYYTRISHNT